MTSKPLRHPCADAVAQFLVGAFGSEAQAVLAGFHLAVSNEYFMRGLEAYCFVHAPMTNPDPHILAMREGMRIVALAVEASRSISSGEIEALNGQSSARVSRANKGNS